VPTGKSGSHAENAKDAEKSQGFFMDAFLLLLFSAISAISAFSV